ncbi:aspartyl protease family protein [Sphingomonas sp. CROZ-RG-20F-R02-07]|uniref:aspartyl protease family protein n=1 Tax=Sphingomonas sp. CROZ-RG-20F-R02-07 TaxID=2914832 RepID=UPI001F59873F|nr:aspartyl protease family protein [Sphingomonas sp. CROZ-RG-20F-R02-07]
MKGALASLVALLAAPAGAQLRVADPSPAPLPLADESLLAFGTAKTRMTVPVTIAGSGPWNFVVDTGAERTVIARELAGVLGLPASSDVRVTAMTGTVAVPTVILPALSTGTIAHAAIQAPTLAMRDLGALGLLGIDALQDRSVSIDFDHQRMTLRMAHRRGGHVAAAADEIVVVARSRFGQLIVTDARCRGTRIAVVVDTGSPVTIGNPALLRALAHGARPLGPLQLTSVTGGMLVTDAFALDALEIGGVPLRDVRVAVADAPPFRRFGIDARPALLLGMDVLRLFRTVQIDFANREIRFLLPRGRIAPLPPGLR